MATTKVIDTVERDQYGNAKMECSYKRCKGRRYHDLKHKLSKYCPTHQKPGSSHLIPDKLKGTNGWNAGNVHEKTGKLKTMTFKTENTQKNEDRTTTETATADPETKYPSTNSSSASAIDSSSATNSSEATSDTARGCKKQKCHEVSYTAREKLQETETTDQRLVPAVYVGECVYSTCNRAAVRKGVTNNVESMMCLEHYQQFMQPRLIRVFCDGRQQFYVEAMKEINQLREENKKLKQAAATVQDGINRAGIIMNSATPFW